MVRSSTIDFNLYRRIQDVLTTDNLDLKEIFSLLDKEGLGDFFLETLEISSTSLSSSINTYDSKNKKQKQQILKSLLNYLNRMSSRATPFGLMSSVGYGDFGNKLGDHLDEPKYIKEVYIDNEWLHNLYNKWIFHPEFFDTVRVQVNPTVFLKDKKVGILVQTYHSQSEYNNNYLKQDQLVLFIYQNFRELTYLTEILEIIINEFPFLNKEEIKTFLLNLIKCGFFISEINPQESLYFNLDKIKDFDSSYLLKDICKEINCYKDKEVGIGKNSLVRTKEIINSIYPVSTPVQVNLYEKNKKITLPHNIGEELVEVAEVLYKISNTDGTFNQIKRYRDVFISKYGPRKEIPLIRLLDEDLGIGSPYNLKRSSEKSNKKNERVLMNAYKNLIKNQGEEIVLTENLIKELSYPKEKSNLPNSLELYFEFIDASNLQDQQDRHLTVLGPNVGTRGAGKTFSRFNSYFKENNQKFCEKIVSEINSRTSEDIIYAEIGFLPYNQRSINVLPKYSPYRWKIPINVISSNSDENSNIDISDLLVGIKDNSIYLRSQRLKKQVIPIKNHMLNYNSFPDIVRFLCDLEYESQNNWTPFNWGVLEYMDYLPRVRYKNTIVYSARWLFSLTLLNLNRKESFLNFKVCFKEWRENNKVPRFIHIGTSSNRLIFDLNNESDLYEIFIKAKKLNQNDNLVLVESNENFKNRKSSHFVQEFVLPIISTKTYKSTPAKETFTKDYEEDIVFHPGDIWTSIKIYTSINSQNDFLTNQIKCWIKEFTKKGIIQNWYFIKYSDPKRHIRLRIKSSSEQDTKTVILILLEKIKRLDKSMVFNTIFDSYTPELERYGGAKLIRFAEKWFEKDSEAIMNWLSANIEKDHGWEIIDLAVISVFDIINTFSLANELVISWIDSIVSFKRYIQDFRTKKSFYMNVFKINENRFNLDLDKLPEEISFGFKERKTKLSEYLEEINIINRKEKKFIDHYEIMGHLIHMNLNRLLGPDKRKEIKTLAIVRHLLKNLDNKRKFSNEF
jgi:lantibiotic biosynthesis protein